MYGDEGTIRHKDVFKISTFAFSTAPIRELLKDVTALSCEDSTRKTTVFMPSTKQWKNRTRAARNLVRPMETVVLDKKSRKRLSPTCKLISIRKARNGTGKTSLSLALAGFFGLNIYIINLAEPALTDNILLELANDMPKRCIVLLENIDTVGLKRVKVKKLKQSRKSSGRLAKRNGITIDGVLNAFNGAASQKGRVLILATNKPANLDKALIRPDRVDLKLCFENITKNHARNLFWRMYTPDTSAETNELVKLAAEFGSKISEKIFSPAEVQNYLIMHKDQSRQALSSVTDWVEAIKQKSRRHRGKPCAKVPTKRRKKMKRVRYAY
ncbi:uncharacterized protein PgNI_02721 [Pyricularia grisea]|uniref:AAA+ ATPase domain-containing protein n=1 Tax=Pyricularia grisea TaxID=148305 RepID=A0A6P8B8Z4_PYRGI|nr:uncharacterized protein PgNI_02721 [Pyricularia grisea]TLD12298.1 hypothetical protein PgNI_02721 [Pyricularia grisea]